MTSEAKKNEEAHKLAALRRLHSRMAQFRCLGCLHQFDMSFSEEEATALGDIDLYSGPCPHCGQRQLISMHAFDRVMGR